MESVTRPDAARAARIYRTQAVHVPMLRMHGFAMTLVALALHNLFISHDFDPGAYVRIVATLTVYSIVAWLSLHFWYRSRTASAIDLAWLFHVADIAACALIVYASGGERSRLFFFLLVPVLNQIHVGGARRALASGVLATTAYFLMLAFIPREVSMSIAVVQASAILMTTGYCAWAGMLAE